MGLSVRRLQPVTRATEAVTSAPSAHWIGDLRAAVQRNLTWMQARGLIREVTGQGRFRMWRATA
jgi:hypothetical protein